MLSFPGRSWAGGSHPYSLSFPPPPQSLGDARMPRNPVRKSQSCQLHLLILQVPNLRGEIDDWCEAPSRILSLLHETEHQSPCPLGVKRYPTSFTVLALHVQPKWVVLRAREVIGKVQVSAVPFTSCQFNHALRTSISSPVKCE